MRYPLARNIIRRGLNAGASALPTPRQKYRPGGHTLYRAEWT